MLAKGDDEAAIGKRVGEAGAHTVSWESEASSGADKGAERGLAEEGRGMVAEMGQMLQQSTLTTTSFNIEENLRQLAEHRSYGGHWQGVGEAGAHTVSWESEASSGADKGAERDLAEMDQMLQQSTQQSMQGTNGRVINPVFPALSNFHILRILILNSESAQNSKKES